MPPTRTSDLIGLLSGRTATVLWGAASKTPRSFLLWFSSNFFSICFVGVHAVHHNKSRFILSDRSDFYMIGNLSMAGHAFTRHMLTSISIDKILLPEYMNGSTNFTGFLLRVEMAPFCLKHKYSVLFAFT